MRGDEQMSVNAGRNRNGAKLIWNFFGKNFVELFGFFCKSHTTQLNRFSAAFLFPWRDRGARLPSSDFALPFALPLSEFISQDDCGCEEQRQ